MIPASVARRPPYYRRVSAWLFTLPGILFQFLFGWFPILFAFVVAFQEYFFAKDPEFVGLANFRSVIEDPLTYEAFRNTFYFSVLSIGLTFVIPILTSILLMEMSRRVIRWMMVLWFIPVASTAGILIWKYMYNEQLGLLNLALNKLGFADVKWLNDPGIAMFSLILPGIILFGPGLMYIAALQSIPEELYEAAELEGAGFWKKIRTVTLPRIRPVIAMMLVFSTIGALQIFELPFIMTNGGPGYATTTVVMQVYTLAFYAYNLGKATALAVVLFFVISAIILIQRRLVKENLDD
jgi:multiple sugar transport system permease protein